MATSSCQKASVPRGSVAQVLTDARMIVHASSAHARLTGTAETTLCLRRGTVDPKLVGLVSPPARPFPAFGALQVASVGGSSTAMQPRDSMGEPSSNLIMASSRPQLWAPMELVPTNLITSTFNQRQRMAQWAASVDAPTAVEPHGSNSTPMHCPEPSAAHCKRIE